MVNKMPNPDQSRRAFVKRSVYVPPAILTLAAAPAYAKAGSEKSNGGDTRGDGRGRPDRGKSDHTWGGGRSAETE